MDENRNKIKGIDFNCDLAQGFGVHQNRYEFEMLNYVSSVNISCGFHAGDPLTIQKAFKSLKGREIAVGAHIGFCDLQGFGNRIMHLDEDEINALVVYQIGALKTFAKSFSFEIEHVRLHGAMFELATKDFDFCLQVAKAIRKADSSLIFVSNMSERMREISEEAKIIVASEFNINCVYDENLNVLKGEKFDKSKLEHRIKAFFQHGKIHNSKGEFVSISPDTVHFSDVESLKLAKSIVEPSSLNYNKIKEQGWL